MNHSGRFPGRGGSGRGQYQSAFMPSRNVHPAARERRVSDLDNPQDDGIRIYSRGEGKSGGDGMHVQPPPSDASNTARIIARRRGLDGSNRSASSSSRGRGRGRGSASVAGYEYRPKSSTPVNVRGNASVSGFRGRGSASVSVASRGSGGPSRRAGPGYGSASITHGSSGYPRRGTDGSGKTAGSANSRGSGQPFKRRSTLGGASASGYVPPTGKPISSSKSTASFAAMRRENVPGGFKRSYSHDNFNDMVQPRNPPNRYNSAPIEQSPRRDPPNRYNSGPPDMKMSRQPRRKSDSQDQRQISDLSGSIMQSGQQRPIGRMTMMEREMDALEKQISQQQMMNKPPPCPVNRRENMKLYDEILSASDPNIGKLINGQGGTASTLPSEVHSALLMGSYQDKKPRACSPKAIAGFVLLILALGGTGAALYVFQPWVSEDSSEEKDSLGLVLAPTISPKREVVIIKEPPVDIEGRCSPSNLPGSLSQCLSGCLPSACCYPDYSGESCYDKNDPNSVEACMAYRPHCDIFYDAWDGSTEGLLRDVTDEMLNICTGTGDRLATDDFITNAANTRNHVRGHVSLSHELPRRLQTAEDSCSLYCSAAKCCSASIITDPVSFGLSLIPGGVYIDATTGEFISTNCQESNAQNVEICAQYETLCSGSPVGEDGRVPVPTSLESLTTAPSKKPSGTVLVPLGSATPSLLAGSGGSSSNVTPNPPNSTIPNWAQPPPSSPMTSSPTKNNRINPPTSPPVAAIPPAPDQLQQACSDKASIDVCFRLCNDGMCCFAVELGYEWMSSCYAGNEATCSEYSSCLALKEDNSGTDGAADNTGDGGDIAPSTGPTGTLATGFPASAGTGETAATTSATPVQDDGGPPLPVQDLSSLCSVDIISNNADVLDQCIQACALGSCCGASGVKSCYADFTERCQSYTPCNAAYDVLMGQKYLMPPAAAETIGIACSFESMSQGGTSQCLNLCEPGLCCSDNTCLKGNMQTQDIVNELNGICSGYSPCSSLNGMPPPPNNIAQICSNPISGSCNAICSTVSCCFQNQGSCYQGYREECESYRPFCAATKAPTPRPITPAPTPYPTPQPVTPRPTPWPVTPQPIPWPTPQPITPQPTPWPTPQPITPQPTPWPTPQPITPQPTPWPTPQPLAPVPPPVPPGNTSTNNIPPPPSDLSQLCTIGPSVFCSQVCMPAKCCFETSFQLNCFYQNAVCRDYAPCASLYGG
jgi:hypothetical protein